MWKLNMKFRLGHFPSLQNLYGSVSQTMFWHNSESSMHFKTWPLKSCTDKRDHWDFKVFLDVMQMSSSKVQGLNPSPTTHVCLNWLHFPGLSDMVDSW